MYHCSLIFLQLHVHTTVSTTHPGPSLQMGANSAHAQPGKLRVTQTRAPVSNILPSFLIYSNENY